MSVLLEIMFDDQTIAIYFVALPVPVLEIMFDHQTIAVIVLVITNIVLFN